MADAVQGYEKIEGLLTLQGAKLDASTLTSIQLITSGHSELGLSGQGEAIAELMLLIEAMQAGAPSDKATVKVFLEAWRHLALGAPGAETKDRLIGALKALRARCAPAPSETAAAA